MIENKNNYAFYSIRERSAAAEKVIIYRYSEHRPIGDQRSEPNTVEFYHRFFSIWE